MDTTIVSDAARTLKNVSMELGGNDAAVILGDMDVTDKLADELVKGVYTSTGQICYNIKRIYAHRDVYDKLLEAFIAAAARLRVGFGLDSGVHMGPLNNREQYQSVQNLIEQTKSAGKIETVGEFDDRIDPDNGYFILPKIAYDVKQSDAIVQQDQFGPIVPILRFESEREGIALANDTEFGLGNSIWTKDVEYGFKVARQLQSGSVFINVHRVGASDVDMPFGGFKQSGIGRGHGVEALHEQTEIQALIHRTNM